MKENRRHITAKGGAGRERVDGKAADDAKCEVMRVRHRVSLPGLPIEPVLVVTQLCWLCRDRT